MELNFFNILNRKSSPDEIAEQIVALEQKKIQCEEEKDKAKTAVKVLRSKVICNQKVDAQELKETDKKYDDADLNLQIVTESIEELKTKLNKALDDHKESEARRLIGLNEKLKRLREDAERELTKEKARVFTMAMAIYGYDFSAKSRLENGGFTFSSSDPFYEDFKEEVGRIRATIQKPTFYDQNQEYDRLYCWVNNFDLEDEFKQVIEKYRVRLAKDEKHDQKSPV